MKILCSVLNILSGSWHSPFQPNWNRLFNSSQTLQVIHVNQAIFHNQYNTDRQYDFSSCQFGYSWKLNPFQLRTSSLAFWNYHTTLYSCQCSQQLRRFGNSQRMDSRESEVFPLPLIIGESNPKYLPSDSKLAFKGVQSMNSVHCVHLLHKESLCFIPPANPPIRCWATNEASVLRCNMRNAWTCSIWLWKIRDH